MKRGREWEIADNESKTDVGIDENTENVDNGRPKCPYLDTINRQVLDFDSEKLCSQTLTNRNVYVCLICGKYFEGRGKNTPAYTHSLQLNHYVFMNLESGRSYCLPDSYEIIDSSLDDIRKCLHPEYQVMEVAKLDQNTALSRDIHGVSYLPGFIGLNNLNRTDDINVILHLLSHISPFRDFFLQASLYDLSTSKVVQELGMIFRKLWSSSNFKSTVSPQELVQTISIESKRKFSIGRRSDVLELLIWLLSTLQKGIDHKGKGPSDKSVIYEPFLGTIEVATCTKRLVDNYAEQQLLEKGLGNNSYHLTEDGWIKSVNEVPFTYLSLDIPPCPLFRDSQGGLVIPQVPLFQLLSKFDGEKWNDNVTKEAHHRKQYRIKKLPRYLILHLVRFTKNNFSLEKNPTIVTFPVRNLEMKNYLYSTNKVAQDTLDAHIAGCPSKEDIQALEKDNLIEMIRKYGSPLHHAELNSVSTKLVGQDSSDGHADKALQSLRSIATRIVERIDLFKSTKYDLVANICHESEGNANGIDIGDISMSSALNHHKKKTSVSLTGDTAAAEITSNDDVINNGSYKIHLPFKGTGQWFELQDLRVAETTPQLIGVSESYILVYEKKLPRAKEHK